MLEWDTPDTSGLLIVKHRRGSELSFVTALNKELYARVKSAESNAQHYKYDAIRLQKSRVIAWDECAASMLQEKRMRTKLLHWKCYTFGAVTIVAFLLLSAV